MTTALSVFGLGYVGCVSSACFAKEGHRVIGVDVSRAKVDMINSGRPTIVESGISELVAEMVREGRLTATMDVGEAVRDTDVSLVCVGTPSRPNGGIDLRYVERVCQEIGAAIRDSRADIPWSFEARCFRARSRASSFPRSKRRPERRPAAISASA